MIEIELRADGHRHFATVTREEFYLRVRRMERIMRAANCAFALIARYQGGLVQIIARH